MTQPDSKPLRADIINLIRDAPDDEFMMYAMAILQTMNRVLEKRKATAERD